MPGKQMMEPGRLWLAAWLYMASVYKYELIIQDGKEPAKEFKNLINKTLALIEEMSSFVDSQLPKLQTLVSVGNLLSEQYKWAKKSKIERRSSHWPGYERQVADILASIHITKPVDIAKFLLKWTEIETPIVTARSLLARHFELPASDKSMRQLLTKRLIKLPTDTEINLLEFLRPLFKLIEYDEKDVESAIQILNLGLNRQYGNGFEDV